MALLFPQPNFAIMQERKRRTSTGRPKNNLPFSRAEREGRREARAGESASYLSVDPIDAFIANERKATNGSLGFQAFDVPKWIISNASIN